MMSDTNKTDRISFRPEPGDKAALAAIAVAKGKSPSDVLRAILRAFVKRAKREDAA